MTSAWFPRCEAIQRTIRSVWFGSAGVRTFQPNVEFQKAEVVRWSDASFPSSPTSIPAWVTASFTFVPVDVVRRCCCRSPPRRTSEVAPPGQDPETESGPRDDGGVVLGDPALEEAGRVLPRRRRSVSSTEEVRSRGRIGTIAVAGGGRRRPEAPGPERRPVVLEASVAYVRGAPASRRTALSRNAAGRSACQSGAGFFRSAIQAVEIVGESEDRERLAALSAESAAPCHLYPSSP